MAKRNNPAPADSVTDQFSDLAIRGESIYVAFPKTLAKDLEQLTRDKNSPARAVLNTLAHLKVGQRPAGKPLFGGLYFIELKNSDKNSPGVVYMPPDKQKLMPTTILAIMTYADYAATKAAGQDKALKGAMNELRSLHPDRTPETEKQAQRVLKTHKVFAPAHGFI